MLKMRFLSQRMAGFLSPNTDATTLSLPILSHHIKTEPRHFVHSFEYPFDRFVAGHVSGHNKDPNMYVTDKQYTAKSST